MYSGEISFQTREKTEFIDITLEVGQVIGRSGIKEGLATIFSTHTTTAILVNENEPNIVQDYHELLHTLVPEGREYRHDRIDSNAASHLRAVHLSGRAGRSQKEEDQGSSNREVVTSL